MAHILYVFSVFQMFLSDVNLPCFFFGAIRAQLKVRFTCRTVGVTDGDADWAIFAAGVHVFFDFPLKLNCQVF